MVLQVETSDLFSPHHHFLTGCSAEFSSFLLEARDDTCTIHMFHRRSNSSRMPHQYLLLLKGLLCLAA